LKLDSLLAKVAPLAGWTADSSSCLADPPDGASNRIAPFPAPPSLAISTVPPR